MFSRNKNKKISFHFTNLSFKSILISILNVWKFFLAPTCSCKHSPAEEHCLSFWQKCPVSSFQFSLSFFLIFISKIWTVCHYIQGLDILWQAIVYHTGQFISFSGIERK